MPRPTPIRDAVSSFVVFFVSVFTQLPKQFHFLRSTKLQFRTAAALLVLVSSGIAMPVHRRPAPTICSAANFISTARVTGLPARAAPLAPQATLFSQDYSSSTVVADYTSVSPNSGQFNAIATSGVGTVVSINSGTLQYARTANTGSFSRTADFSPIPTLLKYKFDLNVTGNTAATTTAAVFQVGSGFGTANSAESNPNTYARFGINFTATNGTYSFRELASGTNSANVSGPQTVTWFMNNTGAPFTYVAPDGSTESLANDTADLWIGTTRAFNDYTVTTATQTLTDLKFVFTAGAGVIQIDNILIEDIAVPTAAAVSLSGRITDARGRGLRGTVVTLEGAGLIEPLVYLTGPFGYYNFEHLDVGTYIVTVSSKRYVFAFPSRTIALSDNVTDADFVAEPRE